MILSSEFEARLLGRVGRGHLPGIKFLKSVALARGGSEVQLEWRNPVRRGTGAVAWAHSRQRAVTKTPGTKATGSGARGALEPLDTFQAAVCRTAVGMIGYTVLDRPDCQFEAKTGAEEVRLDALYAASQVPCVECIKQAQDVPDKYVVYTDSD